MSWRDEAACRGLDPNLFMVARGGDDRPAKAVCEGCPVKSPCGEEAIPDASILGVWGGLSERERRRLRRQRRSRTAWQQQVISRRAEAVRMKEEGLPLEVIADRLRVSQRTLREDLYLSRKDEGAA